MITKGEKKKLLPLLESPNPRGPEWRIHCPYHGDDKPSASINYEDRVWFCQTCVRGGRLEQMLRDQDNWDLSFVTSYRKNGSGSKSSEVHEVITETKIEGWHRGLLGNRARLKALKERKGLTTRTLRHYEIGWDPDQEAYTIPIRDLHGDIVNIRRYQLDVPEGRRKIWSVSGMGSPALYPIDQLEAPSILICEGEWDALIAIQNGIPAITRTGTADAWRSEWSHLFYGKRVFICHDMDTKGQFANNKIAASLRRIVDEIVVVELPYEVTSKDGKDLGDYFVVDEHSREDFVRLAKGSRKIESLKEQLKPEDEAEEVRVSVTESFNAAYVERPLRMEVTVTGKRIPSHLVPRKVSLSCNMGNGKKCDVCPVKPLAGRMDMEIPDYSPLILAMVDSPQERINEMIMRGHGIPKCDFAGLLVEESRTVEEVYVRPSIESSAPTTAGEQDFTNRRVISTVTHDLTANQTVDMMGTIRPNPKTSLNEFQAWSVTKPPNTLDSFSMTADLYDELEVFQEDDDILGKLRHIADDMAQHVTRIYGRDDLHTFMDLVFHSVLHIPSFEDGEDPEKGWLDALVLGDTRTGKSEVARRLVDMYGMGEMVNCEASTYAGIMGGLDRLNNGAWIVKWGSIPLNDRRLVVLDEASGLSPAQIAEMSDNRSSGLAKLTKIQTERAMARTRLLWLANPRDARMSDFTYGVYAIPPLIGNPEDVARFDMAMGVYSSDVSVDLINMDHGEMGESEYSRQAYHNLLRWAWTRRVAHVRYVGRTKALVYATAKRLGRDFIEIPNLIQGANVREKLARISTAMAARTFSTDKKGERVLVTPQHVEAAEAFLRRIYGHSGFGYAAVSEQYRTDAKYTEKNEEAIMTFLLNEPGLVRYLKANPIIERRNMEAVMNMSPERCGNLISEMWGMRAVRLEGRELRIEPQVIRLLRGIGNE